MSLRKPANEGPEIIQAVQTLGTSCDGPTVATVYRRADRVIATPEQGKANANAIAASLIDRAAVMARHAALFGPDILAYAVILPGERVAFAAGRDRDTYHIQLPGPANEMLRPDRWNSILDGLRAMIAAASSSPRFP